MNQEEFRWQKRLKDLLTKRGFHVTNLESHATAPGVLDLNICRQGVEQWIELKVLRAGKHTSTSMSQVRWAHRRREVGGKVWFVAISIFTGRIYLIDGGSAGRIIGNCMEDVWTMEADVVFHDGEEELVQWLMNQK